MDVALLGFLTIGSFLALILLARIPVIVALVLVPVTSAFLGGFGADIATMSLNGLKTVAPIAVMMMFAVLYFGLMIDAGLFEPLLRRLTGLVRQDPVRLCMVTAALPMLVALDGDGATTFLISITALLPLHRHLGIDRLVLPTIVGLATGVMNMLPWGGPTARAMTALNGDLADIFVPVLPSMIAGLTWVFFVAWWLGRREARRLAVAQSSADAGAAEPGEADGTPVGLPAAASARWLFRFNLALTAVLILLLFRDLLEQIVPLPPIPPPLLFMLAFVIALPINRRTVDAQQAQLAAHAPNVVLVLSMILAAGIFTGILAGTGMIAAMARELASAVPSAAAPWLGEIVALTSMPLSLVFTPDAYYFGILPVFAETATALGHDPHAIGRAAILGQMTTGFPLSPLTASTYILIGLSGVTLREHQRSLFGWAFGTTLVMTLVAVIAGAI